MSATNAKIRAERLLYELAAELRFVPVEPRTRDLHVRALELKRDVRGWDDRLPAPEDASAILDEVRDLTREVRFSRRRCVRIREDRTATQGAA